MIEQSPSTNYYAKSYYFDWDKFKETGIAELYLDTYYTSTQFIPERSNSPVAKGLTAFLCATSGGEIIPLLKAINTNQRFIIKDYYNYYLNTRYDVLNAENLEQPMSQQKSIVALYEKIDDTESILKKEGLAFIDSLQNSVDEKILLRLIEYVNDFSYWLSLTNIVHLKPKEPEYDKESCWAFRDNNEKIDIAKKWLKPFSGLSLQGRKILSDNDYKNLKDMTIKMIETNKIPDVIVPITNVNITTQYVKKTFHMIHKENYGEKPLRGYFLEFLVQVFPNMFKDVGDPKELKKNFSRYSKGESCFIEDYNTLMTQFDKSAD